MRRYDPLDVDELGKNAANALMGHPAAKLPPSEPFDGAGVYTIHYGGDFYAYLGMGEKEPIYVGKVDPRGKRQGRTATQQTGPVLYRRLSEHAASIDSAQNLGLSDFRCRWLVLDPVWIELTEQILIAQYQPVWNAKAGGFGSHHQGGTRTTQRRSRWDTLHPGRPWADGARDRDESAEDILREIAEHRKRPRTSE